MMSDFRTCIACGKELNQYEIEQSSGTFCNNCLTHRKGRIGN